MQIFWTYYIFNSIIAVNVSDKIAKHTYDWTRQFKEKWFFYNIFYKGILFVCFLKKGESCKVNLNCKIILKIKKKSTTNNLKSMHALNHYVRKILFTKFNISFKIGIHSIELFFPRYFHSATIKCNSPYIINSNFSI